MNFAIVTENEKKKKKQNDFVAVKNLFRIILDYQLLKTRTKAPWIYDEEEKANSRKSRQLCALINHQNPA